MPYLADTIELRRARIRAYAAGEYTMRPPPVPTFYWNSEAWHNFVSFNDPALTGFLPYNYARHAEAATAEAGASGGNNARE